ncbi:head-to-tail stopper [Gordonia phage VanLee]|uniref:Head-to-tail stopper n=1 Tax=Gordonia phage VanLee TaxID=2845816 RepID=A0A8F2IF58_9CAUD|nr:head-to-tail stopper [Gordonia phage VanLee]QWS68129.1 head-to-tail stopper [Gordonia phage VanLee]
MTSEQVLAPMHFGAGLYLPHRRPTAHGRFGRLDGDDATPLPHVGPCSVVVTEREAGGEHQSTPVRAASVEGPPNADVREGDQLKVGDDWLDVVGEPEAPQNPWTGWRPFLKISLERRRLKGETQ